VRSFLLVLLASLVLGACSGDEDEPSVYSQPLPECPGLDTAPCDTRAVSCQARLLELAACVYGVERAPDVPIRVVSEQQLFDELVGDAGDGNEADPEDAENLAHIERALVELKLLAPGALTEGGGATADIVERIDGVYQDAERGIALVDRGRPKDDAETAAVLVHEFVHAIQDERYDLELWRQQHDVTVDTTLALRSVSEGQATYAQFRVIYAMLGYDLSRYDLTPALDEFRSRVLQTSYDDASPYLASFSTFPYAIGAFAAAREWSPRGLHFAARQFDDPPLTTLAAWGQSYALDLAAEAPRELASPEIETGYALIDQTRLGAFLFEVFLQRHGLGREPAHDLALDWHTDQLWLYRGAEGKSAWLWEIELQKGSFDAVDAGSTDEAGISYEHAAERAFFAGGDPAPELLLEAGRAFLEGGG
jgi:hypothetical protein